MRQNIVPMGSDIRVAKMRRPEKADRTRSERVKQRDTSRRQSRSRKQLRFN